MTRFLIIIALVLLLAACSTNQSVAHQNKDNIDLDKHINQTRKLDKEAMDKFNLSIDEYRENVLRAVTDLENLRNELQDLMMGTDLPKEAMEELRTLIEAQRYDEAFQLNNMKYRERLKEIHSRFEELDRFLRAHCYEPLKD